MAKEVSRRLDIAHRTITLDVEDDFGVVTHHTIPLMSDVCPHCRCTIPGTNGSPDIEASVKAILQHVHDVTGDVIAKLDKIDHPEIKAHVERAKARRNDH